MEKKFILGEELMDWLKAEGLPIDECRRVIIDITVGAPVVIYVEKYGTHAMLELLPPDIKAAQIVVTGGD